MNRPSYSASSASWRRVIGSISTECRTAMRAKCLIEDGEFVFRLGAGLRVAPLALGVLMQGFTQKRGFAVGKPGDIARTDALDREPGAGLDIDLERGAPEPVEQQPPERLKACVAREPEADQKLE